MQKEIIAYNLEELAKIDYIHDALVRRKTHCPKILLFILVDVS